MKLSVSLPDEDVRFLDDYAAAHGSGSRSAAVQKAVRLPRASKAQAEQIRSVSLDRLGARIGELDATLLADLDEALRLRLAL